MIQLATIFIASIIVNIAITIGGTSFLRARRERTLVNETARLARVAEKLEQELQTQSPALIPEIKVNKQPLRDLDIAKYNKMMGSLTYQCHTCHEYLMGTPPYVDITDAGAYHKLCSKECLEKYQHATKTI